MRNVSLLRALAPARPCLRLPPLTASLRTYAPTRNAAAKPTQQDKPRPGQTPQGLEGLFGDPAPAPTPTPVPGAGPGSPGGADLHPPAPPGTGHPSEALPGRKGKGDVGVEGGENDGEPSFKERRKKLSESTGQGVKAAFGGGGGGGGGNNGGAGGPGGGLPGGGFGLTPNQLMWAIIG